ncbi:MAG: universal stress protein [Deltaproteobacteria bacterium]|nr:universal stress protein [Deltaproteobacteria bacterium]
MIYMWRWLIFIDTMLAIFVNVQLFNKNFLVAVDESDNARRAVEYVGYLLGNVKGVYVTLLHVIPEPEDDYFLKENEKKQWLKKYRGRMDAVLNQYQQILFGHGFLKDAVEKRLLLRRCPSMAECILIESDQRQYGTIVVGRQGLSRKEEFLFGSISSKIVSHARHCTVWVVE